MFSCCLVWRLERVLTSSTVLYSPNGATRGVCDLAERIKEAIEVKAFERNGHQPVQGAAVEGEFPNGTLAYNVFVVTGEHQFNHPYHILSSGGIVPGLWVGREAKGADMPCCARLRPCDPELPRYLSFLASALT